jgi:hypothetical protein
MHPRQERCQGEWPMLGALIFAVVALDLRDDSDGMSSLADAERASLSVPHWDVVGIRALQETEDAAPEDDGLTRSAWKSPAARGAPPRTASARAVIESAIVEIMRGIQLGALHQQLGIDANSRVTFQITPTGGVVSDFSTGTQYAVTFNPPSVAESPFTVSQRVQKILDATNDDLKKRWKETDGWNDERETIFAELTLRGVRILDL